MEGLLILQCTLCVVSMVNTSQSGRLVTLCHLFSHGIMHYSTGHEFHRILYIQIALVFEGNFKLQLQVFEFLVEI